MTILGADPDDLEATASRLLTHADGYDNACGQIAHSLRQMDWHGPEADRFRASFESNMRPRLDAAAAFLRQAASELRAQAAAQTLVSQTPEGIASALADDIHQSAQDFVAAALSIEHLVDGLLDVGGLVEDQRDSWLLSAISLFVTSTTQPIGGRSIDLPSLSTIVTTLGMATDFIGFGDLAYLRYLGKMPEFGKPLMPFGVERLLGSGAGNVVTGAGVFLGALNLPGHLIEVHETSDALTGWPNVQPEDAADFVDALADSVLDSSGMAGGFTTPVGLGLGALGYGMKAGAQLDQPIIWACDNIIYPGWTGLKSAIDVWPFN